MSPRRQATIQRVHGHWPFRYEVRFFEYRSAGYWGSEGTLRTILLTTARRRVEHYLRLELHTVETEKP